MNRTAFLLLLISDFCILSNSLDSAFDTSLHDSNKTIVQENITIQPSAIEEQLVC